MSFTSPLPSFPKHLHVFYVCAGSKFFHQRHHLKNFPSSLVALAVWETSLSAFGLEQARVVGTMSAAQAAKAACMACTQLVQAEVMDCCQAQVMNCAQAQVMESLMVDCVSLVALCLLSLRVLSFLVALVMGCAVSLVALPFLLALLMCCPSLHALCCASDLPALSAQAAAPQQVMGCVLPSHQPSLRYQFSIGHSYPLAPSCFRNLTRQAC